MNMYSTCYANFIHSFLGLVIIVQHIASLFKAENLSEIETF